MRAREYTDPECKTQTHMEPNNDTSSIKTNNFDFTTDKITKQVIMSPAHQVLEPIGIVSPIGNVCPKLIMKELWGLKLNWYYKVPEHTRMHFIKWTEELKYLEQIIVPRWLEPNDNIQHMRVC